MRCYICDKDADQVDSQRDADLVDCHSCGSYGISRSALSVLHANAYVFNIARTLDWLRQERKAGQARPMIHSQSGLWD
ncbi:hypothetical protein ACI2KX_15815 [Ectopseudomonas khazarica]|uniref:hypothetical protein n=1 Tax=Ectopseudomonas khazarica TaxID=2502979 RepID=UPI00384DA6A6